MPTLVLLILVLIALLINGADVKIQRGALDVQVRLGKNSKGSEPDNSFDSEGQNDEEA